MYYIATRTTIVDLNTLFFDLPFVQWYNFKDRRLQVAKRILVERSAFSFSLLELFEETCPIYGAIRWKMSVGVNPYE